MKAYRAFEGSLLLIGLYLYIYNPIFQAVGFGAAKFVLPFAILYLLLRGSFREFISTFKKEILFVGAAIFYGLVFLLRNPELGAKYVYSSFMWILECLVVPYFFVSKFKVLQDTNRLVFWLCLTGFVASVITIFLMFNPEMNLYVKDQLIVDPLTGKSSDAVYELRGFAVAEGSTFSYGITNALIGLLALASTGRGILYALVVIPLFISSAVNTRSGILIMLVGAMLALFSRFRATGKFGGILTAIAFVAFLFSGQIDFDRFGPTLEWVGAFFDESWSLISGGAIDTTYGTLANEMFFLPQSLLGLVFGDGVDIFREQYVRSDIGYVIQMFYGGVFYLMILVSTYCYMTWRLVRVSGERLIPIIFLITLFLSNYKGEVFNISLGFMKVFCLYYVSVVLASKRSNSGRRVYRPVGRDVRALTPVN